VYEYVADLAHHARRFYGELMAVIDAIRNGDETLASKLAAQKAFADENYGWDRRAMQ
jgi:hypothetical protein